VNSPVRAFKAVGGEPVFIRSAKGSKVVDIDGNTYVDYVGSWGPMILGHAHPRVIAAIVKAAKSGTSFGAPCELEVRLAEEVVKAVPSIQKVRFVSSGTEAVMGAIRAARGFTGRKKIIKFDGCYHGHADYLLVKVGSGAQTLGQPDSAGVPQEFTAETLVAQFNDITSVEALFKAYPSEIAAVIVEPVVGNMGVILPRDGFLKKLSEICSRQETGSHLRRGHDGISSRLRRRSRTLRRENRSDDVGQDHWRRSSRRCFGGRSDIMDMVAPLGPVYQAGTLSGNPVAMAAGLETLKILKATKPYAIWKDDARLVRWAARCRQIGGRSCLRCASGLDVHGLFRRSRCAECGRGPPLRYRSFRLILPGNVGEGGLSGPVAIRGCFVSAAHAPADVTKTLKAAERLWFSR
jgi:glutamate-1-semialdehyde 2,1-aminomutase